MAEYTLTNTAAVVDASIQKVAGADTTPTDGSPSMVTSGGVKAFVDTEVGAVDSRVVTLETAVAELNQDFYRETFTAAGTVTTTTKLITFTAPADGLYVGLVTGSYRYPPAFGDSLYLYWDNYDTGTTNSINRINPTNSSGIMQPYTKTPVPMLAGQKIVLRAYENGSSSATYDLTFKISRLL